jgi:putative pantetheine hydrolase
VTARPGGRGAYNDLTDVAGINVGHHQRIGRGWLTGTTVVLPPPGTIGGVDVRGGGPGTRETDPLHPLNMVNEVDGICLTGGSAYGLDATGGVMAWLEERNRGFRIGPLPHHVVPIVPAAVIFDLGAGGVFANRPTIDFGRRAAAVARTGPIRQGTVGAGTGAHAAALKGGVGSASVITAAGITVAALVVLNSGGSPVDPANGLLWGARHGIGDEFAMLRRPRRSEVAEFRQLAFTPPSLNTTLAVVATDARLTKTECTRLAGAGHDGMARAISPIHTYTDGDVCFAIATGAQEVPDEAPATFIRPAMTRFAQLTTVIAAAADTVARAIVHAVLAATSAGEMPSYRDQLPSALRDVV